MKKLITLFLICAAILSLGACAGTASQESGSGEEIAVDDLPSAEENLEEENPEENSQETPEENLEESPEENLEEETDSVEGDLLDKLEKLVDGVNPEMKVENTVIPEEEYPYHLFIDYVEGSHAVTSMAMINAVPHSVCLLWLPEDADTEAVAREIEDNLDPRKWICVEAEATAVRTSGQYVLMVMSDQESVDTVLSNFDAVFAETV